MNKNEQTAIDLMKTEVSNWEDQEVFVVDNASFMMRDLVKKCRKNYFGIFNTPKDPITGRKKLWIPLTEYLVESIVKNIDIDTSDIRVHAKIPSAQGVASIFRYVLRYYLDKINFGKILNTVIRLTAIDGTCIVKTWKEGNDLRMKVIDRQNIIVDPSANTLEDTPILEKNLLSYPEFLEEAKKGGWVNVKDAGTTNLIDRNGFDLYNLGRNSSEIPYVEVYERYGYFPKTVLTGEESDEYAYGYIIASNLRGDAVFHKAKEVKSHPYVAFKYKDIWNRFDGRGVAEMAMNLQAHVNEVVNTRLNTNRIGHLGLYKIRGGVTPQQFSKLFSTYAIKLKSQRDDIEPLQTPTVDSTSYNDEQNSRKWAIDVTGAFDQSEITASTPATNSLIQERGTKQGFNLVQENIGFAIEELIEEKVVPIINKLLKKGSVLRITGNPADFEKIQDNLIRNAVYNKLNEAIAAGEYVDQMVIDSEIQRLTEELRAQGEDRFLTVDEPFDMDFDIDIQITDEQMNPALMAQSLTQALGIAAQFPGSTLNSDEVLKEIFSTLGLDGDRFIQAKEQLGEAQARFDQMANQQGMGGMLPESSMNPTPNSRPVV